MWRTLPERTKLVASSATNDDLLGVCSRLERIEALDDHGAVLQVDGLVEARGEAFGFERSDDIGIGSRQLTQRPALVGRAQRISLDARVRVLARQTALVDQRAE